MPHFKDRNDQAMESSNRLLGHLNPDQLLFSPCQDEKTQFRNFFLSPFIPISSAMWPTVPSWCLGAIKSV